MKYREYREKTVTIDAVQFTGDNGDEIAAFVGKSYWLEGPFIHIRVPEPVGLEGTLRAVKGDWVIKDGKGKFSTLPSEIFAIVYEPVG